MDYLIFFLIIIGAAFILPELAKKIHIPYVTAIILAGIIIGPYGFKLLDLGETALFLGSIGAVFLMFTAGLDVKLSYLKRIGGKVIVIAILNGAIPFGVGYNVAYYFGYNVVTSLILGAIFVSSSIAVIIPSLKESKLQDKELGKTIISATVFEDIASLLMLAFILQYSNPKTAIPIPLYIFIILASLFILFVLLPRLQKIYIREKEEIQEEDVFERELRFIFVVLVVTALFFEFLGMHAIIAGFLVGLILSDVIKHRLVFHKIYTISYGIFIPIFFLVVGMKTDIPLLFSAQKYTIITGVIILSLIISKFVSGWLAGVSVGYSVKESFVIGSATIPQLSTTLVIALAAFQFNLLDEILVTSVIILSIITTMISPILTKFFYKKLKLSKKIKK
jgi:Kef-type K+ transport system membrane component KefB